MYKFKIYAMDNIDLEKDDRVNVCSGIDDAAALVRGRVKHGYRTFDIFVQQPTAYGDGVRWVPVSLDFPSNKAGKAFAAALKGGNGARKMTKLWKVTVNNWGWDQAKVLYFESRQEAEQAYTAYPAADPVKYAGNFTDEHAEQLTR